MYGIALELNINPEYFLDRMKPYEIGPMLDTYYKRNNTGWEQTRTIAYVIAQVNSTKKLKPTDILSFPWDEENTKTTEEVDWDEIREMRARIQKLNEERKNGKESSC